MNIKLITFFRTRNYGGILQAYGLYRFLEDNNYEVTCIDYVPERCNILNRRVFVNDAVSKSKYWGRNQVTKWLFSVTRYPAIKHSFLPFLNFMDERVKFTKRYESLEQMQNDSLKADVFITGSDQVWNSQFLGDKKLDLPFYLPFVKAGKKISYASSFGRQAIPDQLKMQVKELLGTYNNISVREQTGKEILEELGLDSCVVVDPTILCPVDEWERLSTKRMETNYYFLYQIKFNLSVYRMAQEAARREGKTLVFVTLDNKGSKFMKDYKNGGPLVEEWLSYIRYADGIITDSFHACIFSILFKRQFLALSSLRTGMSTRIQNLLGQLELLNRDLKDIQVESMVLQLRDKIDWEVTHTKLMKLREHSCSWIKQAIEE